MPRTNSRCVLENVDLQLLCVHGECARSCLESSTQALSTQSDTYLGHELVPREIAQFWDRLEHAH